MGRSRYMRGCGELHLRGSGLRPRFSSRSPFEAPFEASAPMFCWLVSPSVSPPNRRRLPRGILFEPVIPWFLHDIFGEREVSKYRDVGTTKIFAIEWRSRNGGRIQRLSMKIVGFLGWGETFWVLMFQGCINQVTCRHTAVQGMCLPYPPTALPRGQIQHAYSRLR
jgi:hypothetical protein